MRLSAVSLAATLSIAIVSGAYGSVTSTLYGDNDGFGVGAFSGTMNPTVSNAGPGEAPFTDVRLIGGGFIAPAFSPTGGFTSFSLPGPILSATLTMRAGAWDTTPPPVGPANQILLDGLAVPTSFFSQFNLNNGPEPGGSFVETQSILLPASFFPLLSDGNVSLNGSILTERLGSGSFQIDFLQLSINSDDGGIVPEPSTFIVWALLGGLGIIGSWRRRRRAA